MEQFTTDAIQTIQDIPYGKVATYGQVARIAGNKGAARQVARILHAMSQKYNLPWHRVVNAEGKISIKDSEARAEQVMRLKEEGVMFLPGMDKIDLNEYGASNR